MSAPNPIQANDQQDARALPIPKSIGELLPVAWTSSHSYVNSNNIVTSFNTDAATTRTNLKPIVWTGFNPESSVYEILQLNLNNPFKPIRKIWNHNNIGGLVAPLSTAGSTQKQSYYPQMVDVYLSRYKYYKCVKATYTVEIEHFGGWQGDMIMPVKFGAWRVNNDESDFPASGTTVDKWEIRTDIPASGSAITNAPHIWKQMRMHPRFQLINGGQPIGPAHSYGFGTADATMIHTYPHKTSFGFVYTPTDNAEDPSSTAVTTHWSSISNSVPTDPTQVQFLRLFCTNHLNTYEPPGSNTGTPPFPDALSTVLRITVTANFEIQWRDRANTDYQNFPNNAPA